MHTADAQRRRGFTLIELLVVVLIIAVLVSMLLPVLSMVRRNQRRASTMALIESVDAALGDYMVRYGRLGEDDQAADFMATPWVFLYRNYKMMHETPLLELQVKRLSAGPAGAYTTVDMPMEGEHILDYFDSADHGNMLQFDVRTEAVPNTTPEKRFITDVYVISTAGTPTTTNDDIIYHYAKDTGEFQRMQ